MQVYPKPSFGIFKISNAKFLADAVDDSKFYLNRNFLAAFSFKIDPIRLITDAVAVSVAPIVPPGGGARFT
jgi:hypothetical protein